MWWLACTGSPEPVVESKIPEDTSLPAGELRFRFPLTDPSLLSQKVGVDHDPVEYDGASELICTDFMGRTFPWCYDEHDGSDYLLTGGFEAMDAGSTPIVAALAGTVVETEDGNYDRCHATVNGIDCDGYPQAANYVILEHEGGYRTKYWHIKSGSVAVEVGQQVGCGETLGLVGSSGNSSAPHLHFEVEDSSGTVFDPYAGAYSQPESWWVVQGEPEGYPGLGCAGE